MVKVECGSCVHYKEQSGNKGVCIRNPPIPYPLVQTRAGVIGSSPQISVPVVLSFFPPVETYMVCGEFESCK
jgi:hypothetical protein